MCTSPHTHFGGRYKHRNVHTALQQLLEYYIHIYTVYIQSIYSLSIEPRHVYSTVHVLLQFIYTFTCMGNYIYPNRQGLPHMHCLKETTDDD